MQGLVPVVQTSTVQRDMRLTGVFSRTIGPNGINLNFDNGTFQIGCIGKMPENITFDRVRQSVLEMVEELLSDAKPQFQVVEEVEDDPESEDDGEFGFTMGTDFFRS
jgi:hypothetical protein